MGGESPPNTYKKGGIQMIWLKIIFRFSLILCGVIGIAFMVASTILVIVALIRGNVSINVVVGEKEKREVKNK